MTAMPVMIVVLCLGAIAYRYYSAFIAAKVLALDAAADTPAHRFNDGQNFHPTSKWVLFGHHFAAISGAGPLIGPVLAAQFGYMPGLIWIVIGVCLAGAVQDFMVLTMSTRRDGRSLGQIAYTEINKTAGTAATVAILFILVVALAGLGKVVVKALGGEEVKLPANSTFVLKDGGTTLAPGAEPNTYVVPPGTEVVWNDGKNRQPYPEGYTIHSATPPTAAANGALVAKSERLIPGSSWGTFTIACTIPIALLVGLWMYKLRPGKVVEASIIGGVLTLGATVLGGYVSRSSWAGTFELTATEVTWWMAGYGFVAAVLPVWVLLVPRDYLSSFLKIGTIAALVIGVIVANPKLQAPALSDQFLSNGPIVKGNIIPFLFITVMCGAISGFHALIASGTTSKMVARETDMRTIGYGAMLIEGLVAVVAMIAAATLPVQDYFAMNTEIEAMPLYHDRILQVGGGVEHLAMYEELTEESLRGRTGGAVTLAVGMAVIFDNAAKAFTSGAWVHAMWKYWYHFAIMFEALFILTTIDAGSRVGRFLIQEVAGKVHPRLGIRGGAFSAIVATALIVLAWVYMLGSGSFSLIWAIFGVANQSLAVIALGVVTAYLINSGRSRYAWVTAAPMVVVYFTTTYAAIELLRGRYDGIKTQLANTGFTLKNVVLFNSMLQSVLILAMMACTLVILLNVLMRWIRRDPDARATDAVAAA